MTRREITLSDTDYLRILIQGTTAYELIRTGLEFDLFERLEAAGGMDVEQAAAALGVEERPARILLLGLSSLLLLEKNGDAYVNTELARRRFLKSSRGFLGRLVDVQAGIVNPGIGDFAEAMRQNSNVGLRSISGPGTNLFERLPTHPELQEMFYRHMGDMSRKTFARLLDRYDFGHHHHILDVGGGDGTNSIELARRHPHLEVTVCDLESVTRIAAQRIEEAELSKRVHVHAGDLLQDAPLPEGADAIMYFHLFVLWSVEQNTQLLRKCYDALPAGGVCLIHDFVSNDEYTGPVNSGLVSPYHLTVSAAEGMIYSPNDIEKTLRDAGFSRIERHHDPAVNLALLVGHK